MKTRFGLPTALLLLLALAATPCVAADTVAEELEQDSSLASDLVTPHKSWAKGYAQGPVRALFVLAGGSGTYIEPDTKIREAVELMERFDVTGDAVIAGGKQFYQGKVGEARARRLLQTPYDVYVFGGVNFEDFSPELQYAILERVVAGAGLVCCGPRPKEVLAPKRAVTPLPAALCRGIPLGEMALRAGIAKERWSDDEAAAKLVGAYRLKKGRGVSLSYGAWALTPNTPFSFRTLVNYDYWMMLVGRSILWAAGKEPTVAIAGEAQGAALARSDLGAKKLVLNVTGEGAPKLRLDLSLCRSDGWRTDLPGVEAGPGKVEVTLPKDLRADGYYLDVIARSDKGIEGFAACAVEVASPDGIEAVKADASFVERGGAVNVTVSPRGTVGGESVIRVQLRDSYGRILARQDVPAAEGKTEVPFRFDVGDSATILMRVEAMLLRGGEEVEMKETSFLAPKRRRNRFNFVQWASPGGALATYGWQQLREAGWEVCLGPNLPSVQAADVSVIPYCTRLMDEKDPAGVMKPCCWNDEAKVGEHVAQIVAKQQPARETGAFVYSLGDEGTTKGCCVHPACLAAYRRYLQAQYGSIEKLNASWGEQFKSFDEVNLLDPKDNLESGAIQRKQFARWYDRQAFSRYNLAQFSARFVKAFKELDPQAVTGFEGTGGFGDDFDALLAANTFWSPYPSLGDDILRGVAPRQLIRANWMGYEKTADPLINYAWRMVMKGMDSIWWWRWDGAGSWRGVLRPTLDFWPAIVPLNDEMRIVREGLGDLLLQSKPAHSGIAVFYSVPSALSHQLENSNQFISPEQDHKAWVRATYDVGMDFRYLTSKLLKAGALDIREFKVLLLPMAQAIGPEEAQAIRRFAESGGTVIADVRPGVFDDHCKPQTPGVLDELFGIARKGRGKAKRVPLDLSARLGDAPVALQLAEANVDTEMACGTAHAMGKAEETPLFLVNTVGKGRAVLLNFEIAQPPKKGETGGIAKPVKEFVAALYAAAGVRPPVTVREAGGGPMDFVEARVWDDAEATVIGLWNEMNIRFFAMDGKTPPVTETEALIALPEERYVYDLRHGKDLGRTQEIRTRLVPGRANFFGAFPYAIHGVKLDLSSSAPQPGASLDVQVSLDTSSPAKAKSAVCLQVFDPKGQPVPWGRRVVVLEAGQGRTALPIAWNDAPGEWRVRATELFSRKSAERTWTVKESMK